MQNKKVISSNGLHVNIKCHHDDQCFRNKCYAAVRLILDGEHQELLLSDFIMMFNGKYNESLEERTIKAMKHAIEVSKVTHIRKRNHLYYGALSNTELGTETKLSTFASQLAHNRKESTRTYFCLCSTEFSFCSMCYGTA